MIYRSNLTCPDLTPHFKHLVSRPMGHSFGHDVPSDWGDKAVDDPVFGLYKNCGMWTHDEAAILYSVAQLAGRACKTWVALDIGAHTGWTSTHVARAGHLVDAVDPMLAVNEFADRFCENTFDESPEPRMWSMRSSQYLEQCREMPYNLVCIDGDHSEGKPLEDAKGAVRHLAETGVIMLHDGTGRPVQEAVEWLMTQGFKARAYFTPHLCFCCWRGDFVPPDHEPDPEVKRQLLDGRFANFDFEAMS